MAKAVHDDGVHSITIHLQSDDLTQQIAALGKLSSLPADDAAEEALLQGRVPALVQQLVVSRCKPVATAAVKAFLSLHAWRGRVMQALQTEASVQCLWAVVVDRRATAAPAAASATAAAVPARPEVAQQLQRALSPPAKLAASPAGKAGAGKKQQQLLQEAFEETPGPNRQAQLWALQALRLMATSSHAMLVAVARQDMAALLGMLSQQEARTQAKALQLVMSLCRYDVGRSALLAADGVDALVVLSQADSAAMKCLALRALAQLCQEPGPQQALLQQSNLLAEVVSAATTTLPPPAPVAPPAVAAPGSKKRLAVPPPAPPPAVAPPAEAGDEVQLAAAQLLLQLVRNSSSIAEEFVHRGGLGILLDSLPNRKCRSARSTADSDVSGSLQSTPEEEPPHLDAQPPFQPSSSKPGGHAMLAALLHIAAEVMAAMEWGAYVALRRGRGETEAWLQQLLYLFATAAAPPPVEEQAVASDTVTSGRAKPDGVSKTGSGTARLATLKAGSATISPRSGSQSPKGKQDQTPTTPGKGKGAAAATPPPEDKPAPPQLQPPFPHAVKQAALRCMSQLLPAAEFAGLLLQPEHRPGLLLVLEYVNTHELQFLDGCALFCQQLICSVQCEPALLSALGIGEVLRALAARADTQTGAVFGKQLTQAVLAAPSGLLLPPPESPLPSPPPTPPPMPLVTNLYIWDAMGRPLTTDGSALQTV